MNGLKKILLCMSVAMVFISRAGAEDVKPAVPLNDYLKQLQVKLDHTAQRANKPTAGSSAVAGLRGAKQEKGTLYWKGKKGSEAVDVAQIKAYREAVAEARQGKRGEAIALLNTFQEKYPASPLMPDVKETLHYLSQDTAAAKP